MWRWNILGRHLETGNSIKEAFTYRGGKLEEGNFCTFCGICVRTVFITVSFASLVSNLIAGLPNHLGNPEMGSLLEVSNSLCNCTKRRPPEPEIACHSPSPHPSPLLLLHTRSWNWRKHFLQIILVWSKGIAVYKWNSMSFFSCAFSQHWKQARAKDVVIEADEQTSLSFEFCTWMLRRN